MVCHGTNSGPLGLLWGCPAGRVYHTLSVFSSLHVVDPISKPEIAYWQVQGWAPIFNAKGCTKLPGCWLEWFNICSQSRQHKHACFASRIMFSALHSPESRVVCHSNLRRRGKIQAGKAQPMGTTGWQGVPKSNQTFPCPWAFTIVAPSVLEVSLPVLPLFPFSPTSPLHPCITEHRHPLVPTASSPPFCLEHQVLTHRWCLPVGFTDPQMHPGL